MAGDLDIGKLSGTIEFEDRISSSLDLITKRLDELTEKFGGAEQSFTRTAAAVFTAEGALHTVEAAAHTLIDTFKELITDGSKEAGIAGTFENLTKNAGILGEELRTTVKDAMKGTIADSEIYARVNQNLAAGLSLSSEQYKLLSESARALAKATGGDAAAGLDTLSNAMITGRVRAVQLLTGKIDLTAAEDKFAKSLDTTAEHLTAEGKLEAVRAAIFEKLQGAQERLGKTQETLGLQIKQSQTQWADFMEELGIAVATSPVLVQGFKDIKQAVSDAFGTDKEEAIKRIVGAIESGAVSAIHFAETGIAIVKFIMEYREVLEPLVVAIGTYYTVSTAAALATKAWEGATVLLSGTLAFLATPIGVVTIAAGAMYAAFELGKWQPISDFFEKLGLITFGGMSSSEADATIAAEHLADSQRKAADAVKETAHAHNEDAVALKASADAAASKNSEDQKSKLVQAETRAETEKRIAVEKEAAALTGSWSERLKTFDGDLFETAKYYLNLGLGVEKTSILLKANVQDIKLVDDALKGQKKGLEEVTQALEKQRTAQESLEKARIQISQENLKVLQTQDEAYYANRLEKGVISEKQYIAAVTSLKAEYFKKNEELYQAALDLQLQQLQEAMDGELAAVKKRFDQGLIDEASYQKEILSIRDQYGSKMTEAEEREAAAHKQRKSQEANDERTVVAAVNATNDSVKLLDHAWVTDADVAAANLSKTKLMVKLLDGEVVSLQEALNRKSAGGSFTYDLTTSAGLSQYKQMNPGMQINWSDAQIMAFAKQGGTLQQLIERGIIQQMGSSNMSFTNSGALGGRQPGSFAEGGYGDFGSGTMAMLHGKEIITPIDKIGGLGQVNLVFYVNGTGADVARQASSEIMRQLKLVRQFPSA